MKYPIKPIGIKHLDWQSLILETELPSYSKMLAMYLCRYMNKDQNIAWPSLRRIQHELSITRATICKYLDILESEGWILRERSATNKNTRYIVAYPKPVEQVVHQINHVVHDMNQGGSPHEPQVVHHTDTNQLLNHPVIKEHGATKAAPRANGKEFERFWEHWPIKRNKKKARLAWITKKFELADVDELIADVESRKLNDPQWKRGFIPHCSTYLNGERWEDDYADPKK